MRCSPFTYVLSPRSDDELQPVGVGIFPLGAMVNHDCRPNAVHAFKGTCMLFRCVAGTRGMVPVASGQVPACLQACAHACCSTAASAALMPLAVPHRPRVHTYSHRPMPPFHHQGGTSHRSRR